MNSSTALTPLVMLATAMQSQAGVYAVLLGSGVSTGAGIPTGWGVVRDMVRRVAVASAPGDAEQLRRVEENPGRWWSEHVGGELGYSTLLEALAPTAAARQGILVGFFEPTEQEREEGVKVPSRAHEALAQLVKRGSVRVILTTNFDRLIERALEAAGVSPQVIARPEAVNGMTPLTHAPATVVKLHGDYLDLGSRNTPAELDDYPLEWKQLLDQVFNEYGLLVSGWSADWDTALVAALQRVPSRRYPLYWDSRSSSGEVARQLLAARAGQVIQAASADDLFRDLLGSVEALERLAEPPLTTAMGVARLKRYLPDRVSRIELYDLVMRAVDRLVGYITDQPIYAAQLDWTRLQEMYEGYLNAAIPLLHLLTVGVWHDTDEHSELWVDVLRRLINAKARPQGSFDLRLWQAQHYPALLALQSMGIAAVRRGRDALLLRLLTEVDWDDPHTARGVRTPAAHALHCHRILDADAINALPRWSGMQWLYPASHMLKVDLREAFRELMPNESEYQHSVHSYEYRVALVQHHTQEAPAARLVALGEFLDEPWIAQTALPAEVALPQGGDEGWSGLGVVVADRFH